MKLPFSFPFGKKEQAQYFLALLLEDEAVSAVILQESNRELSVISEARDHFSKPLDEASFEQALNIIDKTVSLAEADIPDKKLTKTIFAVRSEWTLDGKIKKDQGLMLKKICDELALEPIGFLVFAEAILHLLQKEEGAPISAILVEVGKTKCTVSLVRAGRIVETKQVELEESLPKTVDNALRQFENLEILPAKIILFDGADNERLSQSFLNHSWSKALPFLHPPQITILPKRFDTKAVLTGTATQLGLYPSVKKFPEILETEKAFEKNLSEEEPAETPFEEEFHKETEEIAPSKKTDEEEGISDEQEEKEEQKPSKIIMPKKDEKEEEKKPQDEIVDADYFGFMKNQDVASTAKKMALHTKPEIEKLPDEFIAEEIEEIPEEVKERETRAEKADSLVSENRLLFKGTAEGIGNLFKSFSIGKFINKTKQMVEEIFKSEKPASAPRAKNSLKALVISVVVILVLCIAAVSAYILGIKATVAIGVSPQVIQDSQPITFDIDGKTNLDKNILASHTVNVDENGSVSSDATGTKDVGTSAKGKITIFSRLTDTTTFPKGTVIVGPSGLKFTLDNATTVASFSGSSDDPSVTTSDISITASDIGKEYNMPSGTKFTISGQDKGDVSAKNDVAFSGGTKNTVTIVSQKDIDSLVDNLKKSLEDKAKQDLMKNVGSDQVLMSGFNSEVLGKKTASKNVGDEAKTINLDGTVTFQSQVYSKNDSMELSKKILQNKTTQNEDLSGNIETNVTDIKQKDDTISATLSVKASLLPKYDKNQITKEIAGKNFEDVTNIIKQLPQVTDATINLRPSVPLLPKVLPRLPQNITIEIKSDE